MKSDFATLWVMLAALVSIGLLFTRSLKWTSLLTWLIGTFFSISFALYGSYFLALLEFLITTVFTLLIFNFGLTMGELKKAQPVAALMSLKTFLRFGGAIVFGYIVFWCVSVFSTSAPALDVEVWTAAKLTEHFFGTHGLTLLLVVFGLSFVGLGAATVSRIEK
jgi:hypothetical protein